MPTPTWTLTVADVVPETADAATIVFDPRDTEEAGYRPGQFLTLRVPVCPPRGPTVRDTAR